MEIKKKISGLVFGWTIGDAMGMPLVGIRSINQIEQRFNIYPVINYLQPDNIYNFLSKGQFTYCTQLMCLIVNSIINTLENKNPIVEKWGLLLFENFIQKTAMNFLKSDYRGVDVLYQLMCIKSLDVDTGRDDSSPLLRTGFDVNSCVPLMYVMPVGLLSENNYHSFWQHQHLFMNYTIATRKVQLFLIVLTHVLMQAQHRLHWHKIYNKVKENILECASATLLLDVIDCMATTDNFRDAVIRAINDFPLHGNEIGAIVGGLAGIQYGIDSIPSHWLKNIEDHDKLQTLSINLGDAVC